MRRFDRGRGQLVSLITIHGVAKLFGVIDLLDFASNIWVKSLATNA